MTRSAVSLFANRPGEIVSVNISQIVLSRNLGVLDLGGARVGIPKCLGGTDSLLKFLTMTKLGDLLFVLLRQLLF